MNISIRVAETDWQEVRRSLFSADGAENAGVLLCGVADTSSTRYLLVRRFVPVPLGEYLDRSTYHLEVAPTFYNDIVTRALHERLSPVLIHSHPRQKDAWYSRSDDHGERRLLGVLNSLLPDLTPASLVVTPQSVAGRHLEKGEFRILDGIGIYGKLSQLAGASLSSKGKRISPQYDRQVRAFGEAGQQTLESLKVGIVGVGGIGSLVGEQLARAGVRDFALVDNDRIEISNVSRQFGASSTDVGRQKVDVAAEQLARLGAGHIRTAQDTAIRQSVLMTLRDRDVIFSCVDNDRTRAILNRFAYQYIVPVVDHGVRLDARSGRITAAAGRVTLVGPGMTCLRCSHHLSAERIRAESTPPEERRQLVREGYIMGVDEPAPAIVSLNTVIAGLGVTAVFNMFLGITGGRQPVDQVYDATQGSVFAVKPRHDADCDVSSDVAGCKGLGDLQNVSAYD